MADTLSESQIQELKKLFDKYDRDKGGKITTSELGAMLTSLGHEMTLEEVEEIINQFDKDGNKTMDFEEFQNMMLKKVEDAKFSKEIITDFKKYDLNGDGFISPNELREVIRVRGERLSNAEVDAMMQTVDLNQDGKVNYEEFVKVMVA
ncbi:calmodulin-like [Haliotis rufescens]|uniref:calmodulin-like n=2 Tax=Haliotis rufescens TaxID=6454 RepID=UPI00201F3A52|nr:calmodulin-like [Haliotis rufescens]XP_048258894.1 calmodulin-like [Haliotis rufescens]